MATLSRTARSLVSVHVAVGVRVQATCAGWSGKTVCNQGESHACWSAVVAAMGVSWWVEMGCSRGHGVSRAAGPQCQHVLGMPLSLCLTGGTLVSGALCSGMDQVAWCRCTVRVACLWPFGASSRMVGGVQPSADGLGSSCVVLLSLGVSCSLGRGRSAGADKPCTPCRCPWAPACRALPL